MNISIVLYEVIIKRGFSTFVHYDTIINKLIEYFEKDKKE